MTDSSVAKLVMTADPMAKADAERLAVKIGGIVSVVSAEERIPERRKTRPICILYLEGHEPLTRVKGSLEQVAATDQDVVLYVASHPDPKMIFAWGMLCQSLLPGKSRGIVSSSEELRAVLEESTDEQSPPTVEGLRKTFSLTQKQLARVADVTERTIQNWERAQMPLSGSRSLTNLAELREILLDHLSESAIPEWINSPNDMLNGRKPIDVLEQGHTRDLLWQLRSAATGEPS